MHLAHTLLFLLRKDREAQDLAMITRCLHSFENSAYRTVVIYNQGFWDNQTLKAFLDTFSLDSIIIGEGCNVGILKGRQACFSYIWSEFPETAYISELHVDMLFSEKWELPLIHYLETHDEPVISCGIVNARGHLVFLGQAAGALPEDAAQAADFLLEKRTDRIVAGFTHPCIHKSEILQAIGGINTQLLTGMQAFEDDSILLGYHYYYGTRANWHPKVCYQSVVYHAEAGQRFGVGHNIMENLQHLMKQYGAMGLKRLAELHTAPAQKQFFHQEFLKKLQ